MTATVSHAGCVTETVSGITVTAQTTTTHDIALRLDAPCLSVEPSSLNLTQTLVTMTLIADRFILTPETNDLSGQSGSSVTHTLMITNLSIISNIFDITLSGHQWPTTAPVSVGPISPGFSSEIDVVVNIPAQAMGATLDQVEVTAASQSTVAPSQTSTLNTQMNAHYGLEIAPIAGLQTGLPASVVVYTLIQFGDGTVQFGHGTGEFGMLVGPMSPDDSVVLLVSVYIPQNAQDTDTARIVATSLGNASITDTATFTTHVTRLYGVEVISDMAAQAAMPSHTISYTLQVHNLGTQTDTFEIDMAGNTWHDMRWPGWRCKRYWFRFSRRRWPSGYSRALWRFWDTAQRRACLRW